MLKRLLRSRAGEAAAAWLLAAAILGTRRSIRWTVVRPEVGRRVMESDGPAILVFWHGRIMLMTEIWRTARPLWALQSPHPDGRLLARATGRMGLRTIWGSSTRGRGAAAGLRAMVARLRAGGVVAITPDGPRGPRMRLAPGAVAAAQLSGAPLVPIAWSVERRKTLRTWDRMVLARPFCRGVLVWGEPVEAPKSLTAREREDYRLKVEERLNAATREADLYFGHAPVEPGGPDERKGRAKRR